MKTEIKKGCGKLWLAISTFYFLLSALVFADLTAVVTPGFQFDPVNGPPPTYELLNLLGEPTVTIYGTTLGTNIIAPGSLTGVSMADAFPDGVYLAWNGASPRQLTALAGAWAGYGLQGTGTNVQIYADPNYFLLATNSIASTNSVTTPVLDETTTPAYWLTLAPQSLSDTNISPTAAIQSSKLSVTPNALLWGSTNGAPGTTNNVGGGALLLGPQFTVANTTNSTGGETNTGPGLILRKFTSSPANVGVAINTAHGLGATPSQVRGVVVCQTAENDYAVGDEVAMDTIFYGNSAAYFTYGANSTNVYCSAHSGGGQMVMIDKTTGAGATATTANWKEKIYAWP